MKVQIMVATRGNPRIECVEALRVFERRGFAVEYVVGVGGSAHVKSNLVYRFLQYSKAEHLLLVDDDIAPHPNLPSLVERGVEIVGAPYPLWSQTLGLMPFDSVYMNAPAGGIVPIGDDGTLSGMVECDVIGGGAVCIKREVLEKVRPAFLEEHDKWGRRTVSEDFYFCREAKKQGYKIWADFDLKCDHVKPVAVRDMITRIELSTRMWDVQMKET